MPINNVSPGATSKRAVVGFMLGILALSLAMFTFFLLFHDGSKTRDVERQCLKDSFSSIRADRNNIEDIELGRSFDARWDALRAVSNGMDIPESALKYPLPDVNANDSKAFCSAVSDLVSDMSVAASSPSK